MPKVSVIIPAYNAEKYIKDAIESVLAQTYPVYEIIVVDDGSTDKTRKIVETQGHNPASSRAEGDTKTHVDIKYIYQMNKGPGAARNTGIKEAKGGYIAFLDSDDMWMPEKIEKQIEVLKNNNDADLVYTVRMWIDLDGKVQEGKKKKAYEGWVFEKLLMENFICCSSVVVKKSCFDAVGLFDEDKKINKAEDYDMWLRILYKHRASCVNMPLVKYRVNPNGHFRGDIKAGYDARKAVFLKALNSYIGDREKLKKEIIMKSMYLMAHSFFYARRYKEAASAFLEAAKLNKVSLKPWLWYAASKICQYV